MLSFFSGWIWQACTPQTYTEFCQKIPSTWFSHKTTITSAPLVLLDQLRPLLATTRVVLLDVRSASSYAAGHLPGAVSLPPETAPAIVETLAEHLRVASTLLVVYCTGGDCSDSQTAAQTLRDRYGLNPHVYAGGWEEYHDAQP